MSIEDIKAKAIKVKLGEALEIKHPDGKYEALPIFPQDLPANKFNHNGAAIVFVTDNTMHILPYHGENYVQVLEESGLERDTNLYVPYSNGMSFPPQQKDEWFEMMEKSRATA